MQYIVALDETNGGGNGGNGSGGVMHAAMLQYMLSLVNVCYNAHIFLTTAVSVQVKSHFTFLNYMI